MSSATLLDLQRSTCALCGPGKLRAVFSMTGVPTQSRLPYDSADEARVCARIDVDLVLCESCGLLQNLGFTPQNPDSSAPSWQGAHAFSPRFHSHGQNLARDLTDRADLRGRTAADPCTILELSTARTPLLDQLCELGGCRGVHVDAHSHGSASGLEESPDLVLCRHVLGQVASATDLLRLVRAALGSKPRVSLVVELIDAEWMIDQGAFWCIDSQTACWFTAATLAQTLERCGFRVLRTERVIDGQFLLVDATADAASAEVGGAQPPPTATPTTLRPDWRHRVRTFDAAAQKRATNLRREIARRHAAGQTVVVWGGGARTVTLLSALGLDDEIRAVIDTHPQRQGRYLPGTGHEILAPSRLLELLPDLVLITNPAYLDDVCADLDALGLTPELDPLR